MDLTLAHTRDLRRSTLLFHLTKHLLTRWHPDGATEPQGNLFFQLKRVVANWLDTCLECKGGTNPAQLMYLQLADMACERNTRGSGLSAAAQRRSHRA